MEFSRHIHINIFTKLVDDWLGKEEKSASTSSHVSICVDGGFVTKRGVYLTGQMWYN